MMIVEVAGGLMFGSIALVADGLHMSTHASALLLAAMAYSYASRHAQDDRFSFGTGKLGDLAGFTSAIVLAMIALLIGYEAVSRFISPVPISYGEAIPIAVLGLVINVLSVFLLSGGHDHGHGHDYEHVDDAHFISTPTGGFRLEIFEDGVPPRFRFWSVPGLPSEIQSVSIETVRPNGTNQQFVMKRGASYFESADEVPEPHAFMALVRLNEAKPAQTVEFEEHTHSHGAHVDNNMRAAIVHVVADAAVSLFVIAGLMSSRFFGWIWMDPLAGVIGAVVIAAWSLSLIRNTGSILLDTTPDKSLAKRIRTAVEGNGDKVTDLHLWRLGPGHFGAIVSVATMSSRTPAYFRTLLSQFSTLSHMTVEVEPT